MHRINAPSFKRLLNKRPSKIWKNLKNVPSLLNAPFHRMLLLKGAFIRNADVKKKVLT